MVSLDYKPLSLRSTTQLTTRHASLASGTLLALGSTLLMPISYAAETAATTVTNETTLEGVTVTAKRKPATAPAANPNADHEAPYKIDKSGNNKFTEPLLNVSKTITVIGKEQLADTGTTALRDLMRTQPAITLGTGEGGNAQGDRFIIRGFEARGDVFVDGMRDPGVTTREVFAAEQIEIAKGASSTFAGRGTTGGAINSITKKPQNTNFTKGSLTLGDDKRATLDANRVINDKLKVRANVMVQDSDIAGRDEVYDKRKGIALSADYKATDKVKILTDYYHLKGEQMPDRGHPWDRATNAPAAVDRNNFYGIVGRDFQDTSADIFTSTIDVDFTANTRWTTKVRKGETTNDYIVSTPSSINGLTDSTTITNRASTASFTNKFQGINSQITHELHKGNTEHTLVGGVEFSKEKVTNQGYVLDTYNASTNPTGVVPPNINVKDPDNHAIAPGIKSRSDSTSLVEADVKSFYVMDTVKFGKKWQVFGGLRYEQFDITRQAREGTYDSNSDSSDSTNFSSGHVGLIYKPRENASFYASASTSANLPGEMFDSGGVEYGGITPLTVALKKPEENKTVEVGTKWNIRGDNLAVGAAIFQTDKKNKIEVTGTGTSQEAHQSGEVRVQGVELNASGNITPKLSVTGGVAYLDTEVTNSATASNIGLELANVAPKSAYIQTKYQVTPKLAVGGAVTYKDKIKAGTFAASVKDANGNEVMLPSSTRLDLMAQYKVSKKLTTQLNINNVENKTIYEAFYRSSAPFTYVAPGRSINVTFNYDF
ncbi:TonB-dependent receptor [Thiofilum flexile]|uniref:TonB-dependent receptor n=1 Tax=Thiofilum flexile TaxID=125627 RepID=UPI0003700932|nr:TonB-dependent siderophore receptor [Thiofilum flexile]